VISINFSSDVEMTGRSAVSLCMLGASNKGTGVSGLRAAAHLESAFAPAGLAIRGRDARPTQALEAVQAQAQAYAFAATGAGVRKQTKHNQMWAFRGPEPWSDPA